MAEQTEVLVLGAGHAGIEAAWAAARLGADVAVCTLSRDTVGHMPCNPAIGGTAKGHLVREIDALGGLMAEAIDATGIQFKLLNRSRGPAVWSPRAQADKREYSAWMRRRLSQMPGIRWITGRAGRLLLQDGRVRGLVLEGGDVGHCTALVITTGTFLNGLVHIGERQIRAGRAGEPASTALAESLREFGFRMGRLKTGTPPRLRRASIDFEGAVRADWFTEEWGDSQPMPFSHVNGAVDRPRVACHVLHTNDAVHDLVRSSLHQSPLYNGQISGIGPRYCPSIEDKVMRFPHRDRHQLFLEPEGLDVDEIYVNGLSTSLPEPVQERLVRSLPGLETADLVRPGYAVEYDFVQPTELRHSLETRRVPGLFLAGQITGTSGYEEAAAQGLVSGVNAARVSRGLPAVTLGRDEAYIGILIDDLVTKGCLEPYRMFTSRAEHRLLLRIDTADLRLTPKGRDIGLVDDRRWELFDRRRQRLRRNLEVLKASSVRLADGSKLPAWEGLKRPDMSLETLVAGGSVELELPAGAQCALEITGLETTARFEGYIRRQQAEVRRWQHEEQRRIPEGFPFDQVPGLSREVVQRLETVSPVTLGQALRIPGVTPAAVAVLGAYIRRPSDQAAPARSRG